jgi:hypothetical protein
MKLLHLLGLVLLTSLISCTGKETAYDLEADVLVIGGGASGTMAGIQSARLGASTLMVEETPWLGGMLTSAGVSAIDGNYRLYSGLWEEFRQKLYNHYGSAGAVNTGWVSNVLYEPSVGANILWEMALAEQKLEVKFDSKLHSLKKTEDGWVAVFTAGEARFSVKATVIIDGTELGDVAKMAGIPYDVGMDSRHETGEAIAPEKANNIVQDLTYVAILKDCGKGADKTIPRPENYDPAPFRCTCASDSCKEDNYEREPWGCDYMMEYGHLPNNKFMINWPIKGNDYYVNVVEMSEEGRQAAYEKAKWHTRCYIYYLQTELGFNNLGIAEGEFPTADGFPLFPYHRESRRIKGKVRFTVNDMARPFDQQRALYRTGIAVGDYAVDHHHAAYPDPSEVPDLHFYPVPSYTLPLGALIPANQENLIVAEKSVSVTNIVNGTTRLQPVCMLIGQAAGVLGALAAQTGVTPADVPIRRVQEALLDAGAYIQPYSDVNPGDSYWKAVQRIGATGIIKGEGKNQGWANLTLFHPDSVMTSKALSEGLKELVPDVEFHFEGAFVTGKEAGEIAMKTGIILGTCKKADEDLLLQKIENSWAEYGFGTFLPNEPVSRCQMAVILHEIANPFNVEIDWEGNFKKNCR